MNRYSAEAVVYNDGDIRRWRIIRTGDCCTTEREARSAYNLWEDGYRVAGKWIVADIGEKKMEVYRRVHFARVKDLWEDYKKVSGEDGALLKRWGEFSAGTSGDRIREWFENTFEVIVSEDLDGQEKCLDYGDLHFELVDEVPVGKNGYCVWNIGRQMAEGYIPFCRLKGEQRFDGGREIEDKTLLAKRCEDSYVIMDAIGAGPETIGEMERFITENRHMTSETWQCEAARRMKKAIPLMRKIGWPEERKAD